MMVELSWPAKALSPNFRSRSHWPKTNALAAAKLEGFGATKAAMHGKPFRHDGERLAFVITAYPPTRHERDDDNFTSAMKGARDGIAKALGIDDKYFDQRLQWAEPCKPGKVIVCIGAPCSGEMA